MPHLFEHPLAVVDVETSGANYRAHGVIDVGVLRIEHGQVTQTFQQLIHPGTQIPAFITQLTGIHNQDLAGQPSFAAVADQLHALLDGCIFVAHNARFDYAFIKEEFRRCGLTFAPKTFCTVKLSRVLYPQYSTHKLDALIERFGLTVASRHRAFDDAQVTWQALKIMAEQAPDELLDQAVRQQLKRPSLPAGVPKEQIEQLPEGPGVYIFEGQNGSTLYVGKSVNIRERVLSHFADDHRSTRELRMAQELANIRTIPTDGELGALLQEASLIKQLMPLHNRLLRHRSALVVAVLSRDQNGYARVDLDRQAVIGVPGQAGAVPFPDVLGVFKSVREAKAALLGLAKEHGLCHKLLGLEKTAGACFAHHLRQCAGACLGKESPLQYQLRHDRAFARLRLQRWPFAGPIVIQEVQESQDSSTGFIFDQWCMLGQVRQLAQDWEFQPVEQSFDLDQYKILRRFLTKPENLRTVKILPPAQLQQWSAANVLAA